MASSTSPAGQPVKSADRVLEILEHLAVSGQRRSLSALHTDLGIPKSSLHGILRTMQQRGWIETDETGSRFGLGVRALLVGTSYIDADDVVELTRHTMDALASRTGETVHLGRLDGTEIVYLATRQSVHSLRMFSRVGRRLPAHATAMGKALLAHCGDDDLATRLPRHLAGLTDATITDHRALRDELERIRTQGYALDREEGTPGIRCIAVPLMRGGQPRDAISISVPAVRMDAGREAELIGLLGEEAARTVSPRPTGDQAR